MSAEFLKREGARMSRRMCLIFIMLLLQPAHSGDMAFDWIKKAGGSDSDFGCGITLDSYGNVVITGFYFGTSTFGSTAVTSAGSADIFVTKLDTSGNYIYVKRAGGTGRDQASGIAADGLGNTYITGYFEGTASFGLTKFTSAGSRDIFIAKINRTGSYVWAVKAGGSDIDFGRSIAADNFGNVFVTGSFNGTAAFGSTTLVSTGNSDIFIAKIDASGTFVWARKIDGANEDDGFGIAVDGSGVIFITGYFSGTAQFGSVMLSSAGDRDLYIARIDASGNFVWAKRAGGADFDQGLGIAVDGLGNSYVTGYFSDTAAFGSVTLTSAGNRDIFIVSIDASGNFVWASQAGGADFDQGFGIAVDGLGNSYVTGYFSDTAAFGSAALTSFGDMDIFIAMIDVSGDFIWVKQAGGIYADEGDKITVDDPGNVYMTGYFAGTAAFGSDQVTSAGFNDVFLAKMKPVSKVPPSALTVTNTLALGAGSLCNAIIAADDHAGPDTVIFQIPVTDSGYQSSSGVWTIHTERAWAYIVEKGGLVMDGFSQARFIGTDSNPYGPEIEIRGQGTGYQNGIEVWEGPVEIYGLVINGFTNGIILKDVDGGKISGVYIGTDAAGTGSVPNVRDGISFSGTRNVQVTAFGEMHNLISGNGRSGIYLSDSSMTNFVSGSYIGLNRDGTDTLQNQNGVVIVHGSSENRITGNFIAGSQDNDIEIVQASDNDIDSNFIGTDALFELAWITEGTGVLIESESKRNEILSNVIGYHYNGIVIGDETCTENHISRNSISRNTELGIDNDHGGNRGIDPPVILSVTSGSVSGTADPNLIVEVFSDGEDEGKLFEGFTTSDKYGNFILAVSPAGPNITATVTDADGNTSKFSAPIQMTGIVEGRSQVPGVYSLYRNFPNPFNSSTTIQYHLPRSLHVRLSVYDILGQEIAVLVNETYPSGKHKTIWNSLDSRGVPVPAGVYLYKLEAGSFCSLEKMLMLR